MHRAFAFLFTSLLALVLAAPGCGGDGGTSSGGGGGGAGGGVDAQHGEIVVGVTSDLRVGVDIDRVHAVLTAAGKVVDDRTLVVGSASSPLVLPAELPFPSLADGTDVSVKLDAFRVGDMTVPLVTRVASTKVIAGKKLLLRVPIDSRCAVAPGSSAPVCTAPETCVAGVCASGVVDPKGLPAYTPAWSKTSTDICKPSGGGAPIVVIGEGQADYLPTMDGDTAQVEAGPQGGHHIWVAIRMKNLLQSGSITAVTGHIADLNLDVGPFQVIFTFDQDEGGYCKLYGLRFQLDQTVPIDMLLGHTIDVQVKVTDKEGAVGIGKRTVVLSKTFL